MYVYASVLCISFQLRDFFFPSHIAPDYSNTSNTHDDWRQVETVDISHALHDPHSSEVTNLLAIIDNCKLIKTVLLNNYFIMLQFYVELISCLKASSVLQVFFTVY
jgi:hypothetical protein